MQFSLWTATTNSWDEILAVGHYAEQAGFRGLWVADHFMLPEEGFGPLQGDDAERVPMHEAWSLLAGLAASVPRLRLGTMVTGNTYRHPAVLAKQVATIDHISGGRVVLGLGAGWQENEHRRYGLDYGTVKTRADRLDEACEVITGLLTDDRTDFAGDHYRLDDAPLEPKPVQDKLPLLIGGGGERRTLRTTARFADEWNVWGYPELLAQKIGVLEQRCAEIDRNPATIAKTACSMLIITDSPEATVKLRERLDNRGGLVGTVDELKARIDEYAEIGVDELIIADFNLDAETRRPTLDRFLSEVVS